MAPYVHTETKGLGFSINIEKPSKLIDSLKVVKNEKELWKIVNIKPKKKVYINYFGEVPKEYIQRIPERGKPEPLVSGIYQLVSYSNNESFSVDVEIQ